MTRKEDNTYHILTSLGATILMFGVLSLLIWAYYLDGRLFISFLSILYLIYTLLNVIYVWMNAENVSADTYNVLFGSAVYMSVISLGIFILFVLKYLELL
jgi:hypothetical protein